MNDKNEMSLHERYRSSKRWFILNIVGAVFAFVVKAWAFAAIMGICAGLEFWIMHRNKKKLDQIENAAYGIDVDVNEDEMDGANVKMIQGNAQKLSHKERKQSYKNFVASVEEELGDFDIDEVDKNDNESEDNNND